MSVPALNPGCANVNDNILATPFGVNEASASVITTQCASGNVTFGLSTRNSAGAVVDGDFFFALFRGGPVTRSPQSRAHHGAPAVCVVTSSGRQCH